MSRRIEAMVMSVLLLAGAAQAEETPDCAGAMSGLSAIRGYEVTIPPAGPDEGWCVLDGVTLRSQMPGWPNLAAQRMRLMPSETGVEVGVTGLKVTPRPGDREVDDRLRAMMRLQTADLRLRAVHDPETGILSLSDFQLDLSGGTRLRLAADLHSAGLSAGALAAGALTRADLEWRNDGKLLRPVLELAGEEMTEEKGEAAIEAARTALSGIVAALPAAALDEDSREALQAMVAALPHGRGKLTLSFASEDGVGAARVAVAALAGDPLSAKALAALFEGATITANWQPGLAP